MIQRRTTGELTMKIQSSIFGSLCFIFTLALWPLIGNAQAKECAVILMHGKWGTPQFISFYGRRLAPICEIETIEMPWSRNRNYDATYSAAIEEIAQQVGKFRQKGTRLVIVGGQSFGANAALAYASTKGDVDGIIALAPGHVPSMMFHKFNLNTDTLPLARQMIAAGQGGEKVSVRDFNQGETRTIRMSAEVFLSYFDPEGLGNMTLSARNYKRPIATLMVIGTRDPLFLTSRVNIFDKIPSHPKNEYRIVEAGHLDTPEAAVNLSLEWLKGLQ